MSATTQRVPSGTYTLDPVHSTFGFAVKHNGISTFRGHFEQVDVKLEDGVLYLPNYLEFAMPRAGGITALLFSSTGSALMLVPPFLALAAARRRRKRLSV